MPRSVMWFRRDLRLADNPALLAAAGELPGAGTSARPEVLAAYVLDPALLANAGEPRLAYLRASLAALRRELADRGGTLVVVAGDPRIEIPRLARLVGATTVHCADDGSSYARTRDADVEAALAEHAVELVRTGSPYAVAPGRVRKPDGTPYRVFTAFHRAWLAHGCRAPAPALRDEVTWLAPSGLEVVSPDVVLPSTSIQLPEAGEGAARRRWTSFLAHSLAEYDRDRDRPDRAGTSRLSIALRWGEIHPRTLLADLTRALHAGEGLAPGAEAFRAELAWREFFADAMAHTPEAARHSLSPVAQPWSWADGEQEERLLAAWRDGLTGYPLVDAGMRQLAATGWMHGRVRMVTASFLVKDLHVRWQRGARHFMRRLLDADLASNQHNWQWVAGTGLDAAPFFRVFNPVAQAKRFDPDGEYVRRWVPELRGIGSGVHEPWLLPDPPRDYPARIVDHAVERAVALRAYADRPR